MGFLSKLLGAFRQEAPPAPKADPAPAAPATAPAKQSWEAETQGVPQELAASEAHELHRSAKPPLFLDVRQEQELANYGFIPGSVHIPMHEIQGRTDELDPARPIVVYCAAGMRSFDVGCFLLQQGFKDVSNLNGGISAWPGPVEHPKQ